MTFRWCIFSFLFLLLFPLQGTEFFPPVTPGKPVLLSGSKGVILQGGGEAYEDYKDLTRGIPLKEDERYSLIRTSGWLLQGEEAVLYYLISMNNGYYWVSHKVLAQELYNRRGLFIGFSMDYREKSLRHTLHIAGGQWKLSYEIKERADVIITPTEASLRNVTGDKKKEIILKGDLIYARDGELYSGGKTIYYTLEGNSLKKLFEFNHHYTDSNGTQISREAFVDRNEDGFAEWVEVTTLFPVSFQGKEGKILRQEYFFDGGQYIPREKNLYQGVVLIDKLRIRNKPSLRSEVLGVVNLGFKPGIIELSEERQTIDGFTDYWYAYYLDPGHTRQGWIFGGYVELRKEGDQ